MGQRQPLQTRRLDIYWNTSNSRRGCPLQEDLCGNACGRRPQFLLLVKYVHKTVRNDTDRRALIGCN